MKLRNLLILLVVIAVSLVGVTKVNGQDPYFRNFIDTAADSEFVIQISNEHPVQKVAYKQEANAAGFDENLFEGRSQTGGSDTGSFDGNDFRTAYVVAAKQEMAKPTNDSGANEFNRDPSLGFDFSNPNLSLIADGPTPNITKVPSNIGSEKGFVYKSFQWQDASFFHGRLYFEEPLQERAGCSRFPRLQPVYSGLKFFSRGALYPLDLSTRR